MYRNTKLVLTVVAVGAIGLLTNPAFAVPSSAVNFAEGTEYATGLSPGLELLVDQTIENKQSKVAHTILDNEIKKNPTNVDLLYKQASLYADEGQWNNALESLNQIKILQPNDAKANKLRQIVEEKKQAEPHNELGFDVNQAYVSDLNRYWNYSSVHYYRLTDGGKFGGHINSATRYGESEIQYQLEAYPKLSKDTFASLSFSYAKPNQILFPTYQYLAEIYANAPHGLEFSIGQAGKNYVEFHNQNIFDYTGTIGKYIGNSFIWFRPHYFQPKATYFYELGWRKYFSDENTYISLIGSAGRLPDIGDVPPLDKMIVIKQQGVGFSGQYALSNTIFLKYGAGYLQQFFPSGLHRRITDGSVGLVWRF